MFSDFFRSGAKPACQDVRVDSLDGQLAQLLGRAASSSVRDIVNAILMFQGVFLRGFLKDALVNITFEISYAVHEIDPWATVNKPAAGLRKRERYVPVPVPAEATGASEELETAMQRIAGLAKLVEAMKQEALDQELTLGPATDLDDRKARLVERLRNMQGQPAESVDIHALHRAVSAAADLPLESLGATYLFDQSAQALARARKLQLAERKLEAACAPSDAQTDLEKLSRAIKGAEGISGEEWAAGTNLAPLMEKARSTAARVRAARTNSRAALQIAMGNGSLMIESNVLRDRLGDSETAGVDKELCGVASELLREISCQRTEARAHLQRELAPVRGKIDLERLEAAISRAEAMGLMLEDASFLIENAKAVREEVERDRLEAKAKLDQLAALAPGSADAAALQLAIARAVMVGVGAASISKASDVCSAALEIEVARTDLQRVLEGGVTPTQDEMARAIAAADVLKVRPKQRKAIGMVSKRVDQVGLRAAETEKAAAALIHTRQRAAAKGLRKQLGKPMKEPVYVALRSACEEAVAASLSEEHMRPARDRLDLYERQRSDLESRLSQAGTAEALSEVVKAAQQLEMGTLAQAAHKKQLLLEADSQRRIHDLDAQLRAGLSELGLHLKDAGQHPTKSGAVAPENAHARVASALAQLLEVAENGRATSDLRMRRVRPRFFWFR